MKRIFLSICAMATMSYASAQQATVDIAKYQGNKKAALSMTFDDGLAEHYTIVAPELEKRGMRGTFGICAKFINADSLHINKADRMTWAQVSDMARRGHEISNHGWAHRNHGRTPLDEVRRDIEMCDSAIAAHTGSPAITFFYPNNTKIPEAVAIAEENRVGTRTFQRSFGSKWTEQQLEKWISSEIDTCGWAITMTHGITYGYDAFKDASRFTTFLDYLKTREQDLWICRLDEAMAYQRERNATKLDVKTKGNKITVTPKSTLDPKLFHTPLTLIVGGEEIKEASAKQDGKSLKVMTDGGKAILDIDPTKGIIEIKIK